ncbi:MAG: glutamine amidotransferase [Actinomycetaceae bacterium]|nr:glutamine amidotransferase [Actinomycetaceae bacterium]
MPINGISYAITMAKQARFLLLATRDQPQVVESEYQMFLEFSGLTRDELVHWRLDQTPLPELELDEWSGIILCGSPYDSLLPAQLKTDTQKRVEKELANLLDKLVEEDFPFLGVCYGVGTLLGHQGGVISGKYAEEISAPLITLTEAGREDPITKGMPDQFQAYVGHKEACEVMPEHAVLLGSAPSCPVQLFKVGQNLYGTQFHPELDWPALHMRILTYAQAGYYPETEQKRIIEQCETADVSACHQLIANFVDIYR